MRRILVLGMSLLCVIPFVYSALTINEPLMPLVKDCFIWRLLTARPIVPSDLSSRFLVVPSWFVGLTITLQLTLLAGLALFAWIQPTKFRFYLFIGSAGTFLLNFLIKIVRRWDLPPSVTCFPIVIVPSWLFFSLTLLVVGLVAIAAIRLWRRREVGWKVALVVWLLSLIVLSASWIAKDPFFENDLPIYRRGLAAAEIQRHWGYVDEHNCPVISFRFLEAYGFSEGLALVRMVCGDRICDGFIDETGQFVFPVDFDNEVYPFQEGLAAITSISSRKAGFIDTSGRVVVPMEYDYEFPYWAGSDANYRFSEGLAAVKKGRFWGYINRMGEVEIDFKFTAVGPFREGLAWAVSEENHPCDKGGVKCHGYIDSTGRFVIPPLFAGQADSFSHGLARVWINGKVGCIDRRGQIVISPQFDKLDEFSDEGIAAVRKGGLYGYIDRRGTLVIPFQFIECGAFGRGWAQVKLPDGREGRVDRLGIFKPAERPFWKDLRRTLRLSLYPPSMRREDL